MQLYSLLKKKILTIILAGFISRWASGGSAECKYTIAWQICKHNIKNFSGVKYCGAKYIHVNINIIKIVILNTLCSFSNIIACKVFPQTSGESMATPSLVSTTAIREFKLGWWIDLRTDYIMSQVSKLRHYHNVIVYTLWFQSLLMLRPCLCQRVEGLWQLPKIHDMKLNKLSHSYLYQSHPLDVDHSQSLYPQYTPFHFNSHNWKITHLLWCEQRTIGPASS